jgi:hypothetical protein
MNLERQDGYAFRFWYISGGLYPLGKQEEDRRK